MIIVNQDTTEMVNFNNIIGINIGNPLEDANGELAIIAESDDMEYKLGRYKTEERTKEVFEMLVKALTCRESKVFKMPEN